MIKIVFAVLLVALLATGLWYAGQVAQATRLEAQAQAQAQARLEYYRGWYDLCLFVYHNVPFCQEGLLIMVKAGWYEQPTLGWPPPILDGAQDTPRMPQDAPGASFSEFRYPSIGYPEKNA